MVVQGVPGGLSLLDRFFEHNLERDGISDAKVASRLVQLLGRTNRGMSDYSVVLLIGRLFCRGSCHRRTVRFCQSTSKKQLSIGETVSSFKGVTTPELIATCLIQADDWREAYEQLMDEASTEAAPSPADDERDKRFAVAERAAAEALWDGDPERAVKKLAAVLPEAFRTERALGAWLAHWQGYATQLAGDADTAATLYREAARAKRELGALPEIASLGPAGNAKSYSRQADIMAVLLQDRGFARIAGEIEEVARNLGDDDATAGMHEEAIRMLGEFLGYEATRPEKTTAGKDPMISGRSRGDR
jgi:hypothetical protein